MSFDEWVYNSQVWLNVHYTPVSGFTPVDEDGETGWQTMFGLTRALQHELAITALSDNFGSTTLSRLTSRIGNVTSSTSNHNVVGIMQCGLWCKGYSGGTTYGNFTLSTELTTSLPSINQAMGLTSAVSLSPKAFKSLLTMDAYSLIGNGTSASQAVQRWLNGTYVGRSDFFIMPCDGNYSRDVQRGLMLAIQYELGMADGTANGNFGPGTQSGLQTYGVFGLGATDSTRRLVRLFKAALIFNGYSVPFNGTFDSTTASQTAAFQSFVGLPSTGSADYQTWASLLVSTGDPDRPGTAADTDTSITSAKAAALYSAGYRTVGRYLSVTSKRYQPGEIAVIHGAGLTTFPIYQEDNDAFELFTLAAGQAQGIAAARRMRQLGFKAGATIHFAVDYDATDDEITAGIIPFFQGVVDSVARSSITYAVGVYGTRNICSRLASAGLTTSSFIAGMSTGWSGNLGFPLPANWSFDQIQGVTVGSGGGALAIDKDVKSGSAPVVSSSGVSRSPLPVIAGVLSYDDNLWAWAGLGYLADLVRTGLVAVVHLNHIILTRMQKPDFWVDYEDPGSGVRMLWTSAYTPSIGQLTPPMTEELELVTTAFEDQAGTENYPLPGSGAIGDVEHFAASTRGILCWGAPSPGDDAGLGDFGGWGIDLVRAWTVYEGQRDAAPGGILDVRTWFSAKVGVADSSEFGRADLQADMGAFLCGERLLADPGRALEDVMREVFVGVEDDFGYLAKQFWTQRFGSRSAVVSAAKSMFTQPWPLSAGVSIFTSVRAPGATGAITVDPSPATLATELDDLANGFADALESAKLWTGI